MLFRLVSPVKRSGSSIPYFVQRIPADVRSRAVGRLLEIPCGNSTVAVRVSPKMQAVRFSLRTANSSEVKRRQAEAAHYLEGVWTALRSADSPVRLAHRQATALAGRLYRAWAEGAEREETLAVIHTPNGWVVEDPEPSEEAAGFGALLVQLETLGSAADDVDLEPHFGSLVDRLLLAEGIAAVEPSSRAMLLRAFLKAMQDAMRTRKRNAEGDYSEDPSAKHYPASSSPLRPQTTTKAAERPSLTGLFEDWWREAERLGRKPSTRESYGNTIKAFVGFLKHDDAARVRSEDVIGFKDFRLGSVNPRTGKPISAKTVRGSDLAALSVIFGWAVTNKRLTTNPAVGITLKVGKRPRLRSKGFTDSEAIAILSAALNLKRGRERPQTFAAKRWVPWLCAYTGARVGEMAQLRKQDVRREGKLWVITITPEAGTVKTDEAREVVLHEHLIDLGFPDFVDGAKPGYLFVIPAEDGSVLGPLQGVKNRLVEFARAIVTDPNVAPNHGWRHRFKTVGMEVGIAPRVLDAIQGQKPRTVAETYGDVTLKTIAAAVEKLPRLPVGSPI